MTDLSELISAPSSEASSSYSLADLTSSAQEKVQPEVGARQVQLQEYVIAGGRVGYDDPATGETRLSWDAAPSDLGDRKAYFGNLPGSVLDEADSGARWDVMKIIKENEPDYAKHLAAGNRAYTADPEAAQGKSNPNFVRDYVLSQYGDKYDSTLHAASNTQLMEYVRKSGVSLNPDTKTGGWQAVYTHPIESYEDRVLIAAQDSTEEKLSMVKKLTGFEGKTDLGGNLLYYNEEIKAYASVEALQFESRDITADFLPEAPALTLELAMIVATRNIGAAAETVAGKLASWGLKIGLETTAATVGEIAGEAAEHLIGANEEDLVDIKARVIDSGMINLAINTVVPLATQGIIRVANNPVSAWVTPESNSVYNFVKALEASRANRDPEEFGAVLRSLDEWDNLKRTDPDRANEMLANPKLMYKDMKLRPSQVNESAFIERFESFFGKLLGGAGVYKKLDIETQKFIRQEVAWMTRNTPDPDAFNEELTRMLGAALEVRADNARLLHNVRLMDHSLEDDGKILYDVVQRGKNIFEKEAGVRGVYLDSLLVPGKVATEQVTKEHKRVIPAQPLIDLYKELLDTPNIRKDIIHPLTNNKRITDQIDELIEGLGGKAEKGVIVGKDGKPIVSKEAKPLHLSVPEYRALQRDLGTLMNEEPVLRKNLTKLSEKLRDTVGVTGEETAIASRMKAIGYTNHEIREFQERFVEDNAWYGTNKMVFETGSDPNTVYGKIIDKFVKQDDEYGAGMEKIVHMLIPLSGDAGIGGASNIKFANRLVQDLSDDELAGLRSSVHSLIIGNGKNRTPEQMESVLDIARTNEEVVEIVLGKAGLDQVRGYIEAVKTIRGSSSWQITKAEGVNKRKVRHMLKESGVDGYLDIKDTLEALGEKGDAALDSLREVVVEDILHQAYKRRGSKSKYHSSINGETLLDIMDDYNSGGKLEIILGREQYDLMRALAQTAKVASAGDSGSGGLAAGMLMANLLLRGDIVGGLTTGLKFGIVAKIATDKRLVSWFARPGVHGDTLRTVHSLSVATAYLNKYGDNAAHMVAMDDQEEQEKFKDRMWKEAQDEVEMAALRSNRIAKQKAPRMKRAQQMGLERRLKEESAPTFKSRGTYDADRGKSGWANYSKTTQDYLSSIEK